MSMIQKFKAMDNRERASSIKEFFIKNLLVGTHLTEDGTLMFFRQICGNFAFGPAFDKWRYPAGELCLQLRVIGDIGVTAAERRKSAEETGLKEIHHAPEVIRSVFQRRTGQNHPVGGPDALAIFCIG